MPHYYKPYLIGSYATQSFGWEMNFHTIWLCSDESFVISTSINLARIDASPEDGLNANASFSEKLARTIRSPEVRKRAKMRKSLSGFLAAFFAFNLPPRALLIEQNSGGVRRKGMRNVDNWILCKDYMPSSRHIFRGMHLWGRIVPHIIISRYFKSRPPGVFAANSISWAANVEPIQQDVLDNGAETRYYTVRARKPRRRPEGQLCFQWELRLSNLPSC